MGSLIEINDTLQITTEQGFPKELDYEKNEKAYLYSAGNCPVHFWAAVMC